MEDGARIMSTDNTEIPKMNKTAMFVTFAILAGLGLIGGVFIMLYRPDATATFTALLIQILGLVSLAGGTFYMLGKQGDKIEQIQHQTNGNLSKRDEEIARLQSELDKYHKLAEPDNFDSTTGETITR